MKLKLIIVACMVIVGKNYTMASKENSDHASYEQNGSVISDSTHHCNNCAARIFTLEERSREQEQYIQDLESTIDEMHSRQNRIKAQLTLLRKTGQEIRELLIEENKRLPYTPVLAQSIEYLNEPFTPSKQ